MKKTPLLALLCTLFVSVIYGQIAPDIKVQHDGSDVAYRDTVGFPVTITRESSVPFTFYVRNNGQAPLIFSGSPKVLIIGEAAQFVANSTSLPDTLAPGDSAAFTIVFSPKKRGFRIASVYIRTNDPDMEYFRFEVSGQAIAPEIELRIGDTDFVSYGGTVYFDSLVRNQSSTITFTIENKGDAPLKFVDPKISIYSTYGPADFHLVFDSLLSEVLPGDTANFTVTFTPSYFQSASRYSYVSIHSNDYNHTTYAFTVRGYVISPDIEFTYNGESLANKSKLILDPIEVGRTNPAYRFTLKNAGPIDLLLSYHNRLIMQGFNSNEFILDISAVNDTIRPGDSAYVYVTFKPFFSGMKKGEMWITDNNDVDENPYVLYLEADAWNPEIDVRQNGSSLSGGSNSYAFNTVAAGSVGEPVTFTIHNTGYGNLTFYNPPAITKSSGDVADFTIDQSNLDSMLASGASVPFTIRFTPVTSGRKTMQVTVSNSDIDEGSYSFTVTGRASTPKGGRLSTRTADVHAEDEVDQPFASPNPSQNNFAIWTGGKADEKVEASVYNTIGMPLQGYNWPGAKYVSVGDDWQPGFYILRLRNSYGTFTMKLIKE